MIYSGSPHKARRPAAARAPSAATRPRGHRAAAQRDGLAPPHSITSSARASTIGDPRIVETSIRQPIRGLGRLPLDIAAVSNGLFRRLRFLSRQHLAEQLTHEPERVDRIVVLARRERQQLVPRRREA
jgi:hypothetical protein